MPASIFPRNNRDGGRLLTFGEGAIARIRALANPTNQLIVRSSILGETIWDRGAYKSFTISADIQDFHNRLAKAATLILASAPNQQVGIVIQRFIPPRARGEFGNLLRVSKTRDHWELTTESGDGAVSRIRFNTQRDEAASAVRPLEIRAGQSSERLFGSVAAWLNNVLLRGRSQRLNCEWLTDNQVIYLVQLDEEDEDVAGVNPFQLRVPAFYPPTAAEGAYLTLANDSSLHVWDKLKVLDEMWEPGSFRKPTLFFVPLSSLPETKDRTLTVQLEHDFRSLIGPDNIIVRTSVRAGQEKPPNLPRTECVHPDQAALWCLSKRDEFRTQRTDLANLAFIAHRFIAAKASAWVRADPSDPVIEIHGLWGLPDALQYCPYDIWEVHLPTEVATEFPESPC